MRPGSKAERGIPHVLFRSRYSGICGARERLAIKAMLAGVSRHWEHAPRTRQQVRRNDAGVPRYNSIMCTHTQYYVTHDVLFHLTTSVGIFSQALKGIERALASSQRLEEEERAAREMHQECMQASKIYEQLLDTAAKVYADSIVGASAPQHRWV